MSALVKVRELDVLLPTTGANVVTSITFDIGPGEILAVVGESGSGKTTIATALLGYARPGSRISHGSIMIGEQMVVPRPKEGLAAIRGNIVAYVPQDPSASLSPAMRIGTQLRETLLAHRQNLPKAEQEARIHEVLDEVKLSSDAAFLRRYPHQLSGGQQQRICMAMAVLCRPRLLILDEPTTGLDVSTQAHVLATLTELVVNHGLAGLYVTHDLAVVAQIARRVMVLYAGEVVELAATSEIFNAPLHPYTGRLLAAIPDVAMRRMLKGMPGHAPGPTPHPIGCSFAPRCHLATSTCAELAPTLRQYDAGRFVACHRAGEDTSATTDTTRASEAAQNQAQSVLEVRDLSVRYGLTEAVKSVSFDLKRGECLAIVGESGSGKTTLSRAIVGLGNVVAGTVRYEGLLLPTRNANFTDSMRRAIQYIFQSSHNALNPRRSIGASLYAPIRQYYEESDREATERALAALGKVSLSRRTLARLPSELSGGERQRAAIARALISEPNVLLCDEITSALDVSVQASIVALLEQLRKEESLSVVFVTHNTALVRTIADRVVVLLDGTIVEDGETSQVFDHPRSAYTRELIANTPVLETAGKKRVEGLALCEGAA
ncbi:MAG: ABC transporter ATP-binding protein [Solirubrobacteraceae bacterium]